MYVYCMAHSQHLLNVMEDQKENYVDPLQEYTDTMAEEEVLLREIQSAWFPDGSVQNLVPAANGANGANGEEQFVLLQESVSRMLALVGKHEKLTKRLVKGGKWINRTANVLKYAQTPTAQNVFAAMDKLDDFIGNVSDVLNDPELPVKLRIVEDGFTAITSTLEAISSGAAGR